MRHTQKQRPTAYALARAALIVAQPQFFDLIEVNFNLAAPRIRVDGLHGIKSEVGTQQIPGREGEPGDGNNDYAGGQRAVGPHAAQQDFRIADLDGPRATPHPQDRLLTTQAVREAGEPLLDATALAKHARAALPSRATARGA